jgi:tRNA dimethylallyltransferase
VTPARPGSPAAGEGPVGIALVGPTATGKSDLAVAVAEALDGEVVSVDSRQAYRGLEVGTAAPTPVQRAAVPHHGVAFLEPGERYSAGRFSRLARGWIREIRGRDRVPVLAGGTGFFLSTLIDPVFREPAMEAGRREALRAWLEGRPARELRRWTARLDPDLARALEALDPQRCARTLELALLSGRPVSWWQAHGSPEAPPLELRVFVLELGPRALKERIRARARALVEGGWPAEVERLLAAGAGEEDPALSALGYREVARLVRGAWDAGRTIEAVTARTWQYARRQRTWFRNQLPGDAVRLDAGRPTPELARTVVTDWREASGGEA